MNANKEMNEVDCVSTMSFAYGDYFQHFEDHLVKWYKGVQVFMQIERNDDKLFLRKNRLNQSLFQ